MNPHLDQPLRYYGTPLDAADAVVVAVHGRNQEPAFMQTVFDRLGWEGAACVLPTAADRSWYPGSFMAPIEENEPRLSQALEAYDHWVETITNHGVDRERIVLMGFSQGACLTAEYAVRNPTRYGGLIILTGGAIGPPGTTWDPDGSLENTPAFLGTSDVDEWVPVERVHETTALFRRLGADVTERVYEGMGHLVSDDEVAEIRRLLITP